MAKDQEKQIRDVKAEMVKLAEKFRTGKIKDSKDFLKKMQILTEKHRKIILPELYS